MMRTEDDLRAAFFALERHAPDADDVMRAVYDQSRRPARLRRLLEARPRLRSRRCRAERPGGWRRLW